MLPRPDAVIVLCLNIQCPRHDKCVRYVKGGNLTVGEFFNYQWIEDCNNYKMFVERVFFKI